MMNSKELALKQIEKARENLNLAYKLLDYPEEIELYFDDVDTALDNVKYEIKKMKTPEPEAEDPTDRQIDEMILKKLEEKKNDWERVEQ